MGLLLAVLGVGLIVIRLRNSGKREQQECRHADEKELFMRIHHGTALYGHSKPVMSREVWQRHPEVTGKFITLVTELSTGRLR
jgi:hypothetical protein